MLLRALHLLAQRWGSASAAHRYLGTTSSDAPQYLKIETYSPLSVLHPPRSDACQTLLETLELVCTFIPAIEQARAQPFMSRFVREEGFECGIAASIASPVYASQYAALPSARAAARESPSWRDCKGRCVDDNAAVTPSAGTVAHAWWWQLRTDEICVTLVLAEPHTIGVKGFMCSAPHRLTFRHDRTVSSGHPRATSDTLQAGTRTLPLDQDILPVHHSIMWRLGHFVVVAAIAACLVQLSSAAATPKLRRAVVGDSDDERPLGRRWFIDWGGSLGRLPSRDDMITPVDSSSFEASRAATESSWEQYRRRLAREQAEYWSVIFGGHTP